LIAAGERFTVMDIFAAWLDNRVSVPLGPIKE
jgi:hypothetical protein